MAKLLAIRTMEYTTTFASNSPWSRWGPANSIASTSRPLVTAEWAWEDWEQNYSAFGDHGMQKGQVCFPEYSNSAAKQASDRRNERASCRADKRGTYVWMLTFLL